MLKLETGVTLLDKEPWRPSLETVRATAGFARLIKRAVLLVFWIHVSFYVRKVDG